MASEVLTLWYFFLINAWNHNVPLRFSQLSQTVFHFLLFGASSNTTWELFFPHSVQLKHMGSVLLMSSPNMPDQSLLLRSSFTGSIAKKKQKKNRSQHWSKLCTGMWIKPCWNSSKTVSQLHTCMNVRKISMWCTKAKRNAEYLSQITGENGKKLLFGFWRKHWKGGIKGR